MVEHGGADEWAVPSVPVWMQSAIERDLESFGLAAHEARVVVALLRAGTATAGLLDRACADLPVGAEQVLDALAMKGLAEPVPGGEGVWASVGRDEVINRLFVLEQERLQSTQVRMEQTRRLLACAVPDDAPASIRDIHLVRGAAQTERAFERLLAGAQHEVLVFNRPPYGLATTMLDQCIVAMLARGVEARVLYRTAELESTEADLFRAETAHYIRLGVNAGVVDELPLKLAIVDRRTALATLVGPDGAPGFPTSMLVENHGFAVALAATFEHYWRGACSVAALLGLGL